MKAIYIERARKVANMAWLLVKDFNFTMSEAMRKAWAMVKMRAQMNTRIVEFFYTKKDGSVRAARGTLSHNIIPQTKGERTPSKNVFTYYDEEREDWRCFKINNFIGVAV